MSFATDKACALDKIRAFGCDYVDQIDALLTNYDDIPGLVYSFTSKFECFPLYLTSLLTCFDGPSLAAEGIIFNNGAAGALVNPNLVVDSNATSLEINAAAEFKQELIIGGTSIIDEVDVTGSLTQSIISVIGGAKVKVLGTTGAAILSLLRVSGCRNSFSSVDKIVEGSSITSIDSFGGGTVGPFLCVDPTFTCAVDVSMLSATNVTAKSATLTWGAPSESLYTNIYYRISGDGAWKNVINDNGDGITGNYTESLGYVFRGLQAGTYYDFKVVNVCNNGIPSDGQTITQQTASI